jgi:hypothetical protein
MKAGANMPVFAASWGNAHSSKTDSLNINEIRQNECGECKWMQIAVSPIPNFAMPRFNVARTPPLNISPGTIAAKPVCHRCHRQNGTSYSLVYFCFLIPFKLQ